MVLFEDLFTLPASAKFDGANLEPVIKTKNQDKTDRKPGLDRTNRKLVVLK